MDPALPKGKKEATRFARKASEALWGLLPYARRHSSLFLMGLMTAVCVVAVRLALPWPLRKVADQWMITPGQSRDEVLRLLPPNWDLAFIMGLIFLLLLLMLGYFDYRERLYFARFASSMVREMRSDVLRVASHISQEERTLPPGDLVTRLLGDSGRVRSGLQGFLVHVATSGLVFCGVTLVLLGMSIPLGLIFAAAGIGMAILTTWGATRTFKKSLKNRKKEGKLANHIHEVLEFGGSSGTIERPSKSDGSPHAGLTRIQGIVTWMTHAVFGTAVLAALWVGSGSVKRGEMKPGDMIVFMMYTLMMRGPIIRLARQGCKSGKILGSAYRLVQVFQKARASGSIDTDLVVSDSKTSNRRSERTQNKDHGPTKRPPTGAPSV